MGVAFSPAWEYWVPDPEFTPDADAVDQADRLPRTKDARTGRPVLDGFRVGRGDPNREPFVRFARPKCDRPDRLPLRRCPSCPRLFTPRHAEHKYCSPGCSNAGRTFILPRPCRNPTCGRTFRPESDRIRCCSAACAARVSGLARAGRERGPSPLRGRPNPNAGNRPTLDWQRFADLHADGHSARQIARREGVSKDAVLNALRTLGVYTAGRPGRSRVLPDRPCGHCRDPFRPHHDRQRFCSRPCELAGRGRKQIDPARVLALARAGRNNCQIARELGCSVTGVRRIVNANRSPAPGESQQVPTC